ncbi:MAG: hypothetical protein KGK09_08710 [Burkholderiales bacterium]|nr:hypothetical protein [Burkholderiales bacterium]
MPPADPLPAALPGPRPWWRHGMVWLVIAGPAAAVVAGLTTVWIAVRHADVEILDPPPASAAPAAVPAGPRN